MKYKVNLCLLALFIMGAICSCAKHSSDNDNEDETDEIKVVKTDNATIQKLLDKYYHGEGWTKADYANAIDIVEEISTDYIEKANSALNKCNSREEFYEKQDILKEKTDGANDLWRILNGSDESEMGKENLERWIKYAHQYNIKQTRLWKAIDNKFGNDYGYDSCDSAYIETEYEVVQDTLMNQW